MSPESRLDVCQSLPIDRSLKNTAKLLTDYIHTVKLGVVMLVAALS